MKLLSQALLCLTVAFSSATNATEVYKWIDTNGVPSYGERPPEGVAYTKMKLYNSGAKTTLKVPKSANQGYNPNPTSGLSANNRSDQPATKTPPADSNTKSP